MEEEEEEEEEEGCRINRFGLLVRMAAGWGGPNQGGLKVKPAFSETSISSQARLHKRSEKKCLVSQDKKCSYDESLLNRLYCTIQKCKNLK